MLDLQEWRARLDELRESSARLGIDGMHDLIDGCRHLLRHAVSEILRRDDVRENRRQMSQDERLAWARDTRLVVDFARCLITSYLTGGEIFSWSDNKEPAVYYLVTETLAGLSPQELKHLLHSAFVMMDPRQVPLKYQGLARTMWVWVGDDRKKLGAFRTLEKELQ